MKYLFLAITVLVLGACKTYSEDDKNSFDAEIKKYIEKHNIDCEKSSSGLYYTIIEQGEGRPIQYKDMVTFTYKGELLDGTVFDDQTHTPVEFRVDQLIGAWKEIMLMLNNGGKAYLIAPPQLGYGTHDLEDIPASSILIFEMEIKDVK